MMLSHDGLRRVPAFKGTTTFFQEVCDMNMNIKFANVIGKCEMYVIVNMIGTLAHLSTIQ